MKTLIYFFLSFITISVTGQVGINTQTPETTLEVVGKPNDISHYDGIIPPRITGNQLAAKTYSSAKQGAMVYAISPPSNLTGQVKNITESAPYYFDGTLWQTFSTEVAPIEYYIILTLDPNRTASLTATSVCVS